ncbi:hypothetical protein [Polyangium aurulentum]|uniref:hypothetical protein n=1 Tax=Polyangium aurulentum TaxID=2567896 RepID=UPI0010ADF6E7|nr:hypothetical protein [Polyangium aurulentum]UQA56082.1 hypothetical protein E8A73_032850 [Polyangium aurulentum]
MFVCFRRGALALVALVFAGVGCAEAPGRDLALVQIQHARAEARAQEARVATLEARQGMALHQVWVLSNLVGTLARDNAQRAEDLARQNEALAARVERVEKAEHELARAQAEAESPQAILRKVQTLIDAGQVKVVVKNGRARLEGSLVDGKKTTTSDVVPELENPWARPTKPASPKAPDDRLGF